jgi:hypothetical protein
MVGEQVVVNRNDGEAVWDGSAPHGGGMQHSRGGTEARANYACDFGMSADNLESGTVAVDGSSASA